MRIFEPQVSSIKISGFTTCGQSIYVTFTKDSITEVIGDTKVVHSGTPSDCNIALLVMRLLNGESPFDYFEHEPSKFADLTSAEQVKEPGVFTGLLPYRLACKREADHQAAAQQALASAKPNTVLFWFPGCNTLKTPRTFMPDIHGNIVEMSL